MRVLAAAILVVALAGCAAKPSATLPSVTDSSPTGPAAIGNATLPNLGPAIDPWAAGEVERVLFDGTVQAGDCYTGAMAFELTAGYVMGGCVFVPFEPGNLVPAGTAALKVDVDASAAVQQGGYIAFLYTRVRQSSEQANAESTSDPQHTWTFPLVATEWDNPAAPRTQVEMGLWTENSVLNGDVKIHVAATRMAGWLPSPPIDHWRMAHPSPQDGVITMLDANLTWDQPGAATERAGKPWPEFPGLAGLVPAGATTLVASVAWTGLSGCDAQACDMALDMGSATTYRNGYTRLADEKAPGLAIYLYKIPDETAADPDWLNQTDTWVYPGFYSNPDQWANCQQIFGTACHPANDVSAQLHVIVEAWRGAVDLAAVKARLGVAGS